MATELQSGFIPIPPSKNLTQKMPDDVCNDPDALFIPIECNQPPSISSAPPSTNSILPPFSSAFPHGQGQSGPLQQDEKQQLFPSSYSTFRDENKQIEIQYPSSWQMEETANGVSFSSLSDMVLF